MKDRRLLVIGVGGNASRGPSLRCPLVVTT